MHRQPNTPRGGGSFQPAVIVAVWQKAQIVPGIDPAVRRHGCGAWIDFAAYGQTVADGRGWEIDHIVPVSLGGTDDLLNLQPLQWQNNRHKGDNYPHWSCRVKAAA